MNLTERWLHGERQSMRDWPQEWAGELDDQARQRRLSGLEALEAAGALTAAEADAWRAIYAADEHEAAEVVAEPDVCRRAEAMLEQLLGTLPTGGDDGAGAHRFEGALHLLSAIGAVSAAEWDARHRARRGWPGADEELLQEMELNRGGTEVQLLGVHRGPEQSAGPYRLLLVLRFADGVSVWLDQDEDTVRGAIDLDDLDMGFHDWRLTDDLGTPYSGGGGSSSDVDANVSFRTPIPPQAAWLELTLDGQPDVRLRVDL